MLNALDLMMCVANLIFKLSRKQLYELIRSCGSKINYLVLNNCHEWTWQGGKHSPKIN